MDLLSGGVDEDLYNNLYENETLLNNDNSFFESPVLIADSVPGDWKDVINEIVSQYNATYPSTIAATRTYFSGSYLTSGHTYQLGFGTSTNTTSTIVTRVYSILNGLEYGGYRYYDCTINDDSGTSGAYIVCYFESK